MSQWSFRWVMLLIASCWICQAGLAQALNQEQQRKADPRSQAFHSLEGKVGLARLVMLDERQIKVKGAQVFEYLSIASTEYRENYYTDANSKPVLMIYSQPSYASASAAFSYLESLGLIDLAERAAVDLYLISAVNGQSFDDRADWVLFDRLQYFIPTRNNTNINNTKLIGIEAGANFVNNTLSAHMGRVAGVLTYGGSMVPTLTPRIPVPAYLAGNPQRQAIEFYQRANGINHRTRPAEVAPGVLSYTHQKAKLQRVMVDSSAHSPAAAIAAGFRHLLQHNARMVLARNFWLPEVAQQSKQASEMIGTLVPIMPLDGSSPVEFIKITNGVVNGESGHEWLEFVPKTVRANPDKKVPLVVFFHGGGNDNGQVFTSGWPEIAARDNVIVASVEFYYHDLSIEDFIDLMIKKYPIDETRIYATGLSGGGFNTNVVSLLMGERLAAVGAFAGADHVWSGIPAHYQRLARIYKEPRYPFEIDSILAEFNRKGIVLPYSFSCGSNDRSFPIWYPAAEGQDWQLLPMLNIIGRYNNIQKLAQLDRFDIDITRASTAVIGYPLENQKTIKLTDLDMIVGGFADSAGRELVFMSSPLNLQHWYYYEATAVVWDWMKQFSRDPKNYDLYKNGKLFAQSNMPR